MSNTCCILIVALVGLQLAHSFKAPNNAKYTDFAFTNGQVEVIATSVWAQEGQFFGFAEQLLEPNRVVGIIELGSDSVNMSIQSIFVADNGTVILGNAANVGSSSCE